MERIEPPRCDQGCEKAGFDAVECHLPGMYHSASEVVREGLRALQKKEQEESLDALLQARLLEAKSGKTVSLDEAKASIKARLEEKYQAESGA